MTRTKSHQKKQVQREVRRRLEAERKKRFVERTPDDMDFKERMLHELQRLNESSRWLEENGFSRRAVVDVTPQVAYISLMFDVKKWGMTPEPDFCIYYKAFEQIK